MPAPHITDPQLLAEWLFLLRYKSERCHCTDGRQRVAPHPLVPGDVTRYSTLGLLALAAGTSLDDGFFLALNIGLLEGEIDTILDCERNHNYTFEELAGLIEYYAADHPDWPPQGRPNWEPPNQERITLAAWLN